MRLKLEISPQMVDKFQDKLEKQMGAEVWGVKINDIGNQYEFRFRMHDSEWHFQLDKNTNGMYYKLHCSTRELDLPAFHIKDLKLFCKQIARIKQMQTDYVNSK
jgi:hypothetical protein